MDNTDSMDNLDSLDNLENLANLDKETLFARLSAWLTAALATFDWTAHEIPENKSHGLSEEEARLLAIQQNQKIDLLMASFTRGFDPSTFGTELMVQLPAMEKIAFPGSYEQLFMLLLSSSKSMDNVQSELQEVLSERYPPGPQGMSISSTSVATDKADENYFLSELQILRKLLEPLRGERKNPIYWMNSRRFYPASVCEQLEAAVRVVEDFKRDVLKALEKDTEDRTCYSTLPACSSRSSMMSMRETRIDACKAAIKWNGFEKADLELTRFYNFYKDDAIKNRPEKAREQGWLPPTATETPRSSSQKASQGDPVVWPGRGGNKKLFDLLLKTAIWLAVARGLAAVHLFCDVARLFTTHAPYNVTKAAYLRFLRHLVQIKAHDKVQFHTADSFPYRDDTVINWHHDYFEGVSSVNHTVMAKLAHPPTPPELRKTCPPLTPVDRYLEILKTPSGLPRTWPRTANKYMNGGTSVYKESTEGPHRPIRRSYSASFFQGKASSLPRRIIFLDEPPEEKSDDEW